MTDRYHGILNINKPTAWTSHDVVARVRRIAGQRSAGHAGTLDPAATGVLLVCLGQATRVTEYLMAGDKTYRALVHLGTTTDTYDADGEVTATGAVPDLSAGDLECALAEFSGEIQQLPPAYSAIKQDGVPLHRRARRGEEVQLQARPVTIYRIDVLEWRSPDLSLDVTCAPGTYIRSLAHDLGQRLGCGAHLAGLMRTRSGRFSLAEAITLETLADASAQGALERHLHPLEDALGSLVVVPVDEQATEHLVHGRPIPAGEGPAGDLGYARAANGQVVAILQHRAGQWWPQKVFAAGQPSC
jgi:tRNA pseudouridine55 synthase